MAMKKNSKYHFSISQISLSIILGFLFGIATRSLVEVQFWWLGFTTGVIFVSVLAFKSKRIGRLLFLCIGILLGVWRMDGVVLEMNSMEDNFDFSAEVVVVRVPEVKEEYQKIVVRLANISEKMNRNGNLLIFAKPKPTIEFGEHLQVSCNAKIPENKHKKFNYRRFLASKKIFYICSFSKVQKLLIEKEEGFFGKIFSIRARFEKQIGRLFPEPEAGYLAGLLLGGDDRLPKDVAENFRLTGTTHTVAVSGYNITIIASILMWFGIGIGLWRKQAFFLALSGIVLFVVMIGAPSSATRAAVMGALLLWAMQKGRLASSVRVAVFAAAAMVLHSPFILLYDVGFQLSFLATLGIILVYTPLSLFAEIKEDFLELKSIVLVTISAQVGVLGLLVYTFESFSLISLLANLIILPLIPVIMLLGFGVILVSFLFPFVAKIIALVVWFLLHIEIIAIEWLAKVPFANIEIGDVGVWWMAGYYLFFVGVVFKLKEVKK